MEFHPIAGRAKRSVSKIAGRDRTVKSSQQAFRPINAYLQMDQCSVGLFVPEGQRVHGIIKCVVSPDEMTSTPSEIVSSSINNLTVWYGESGPISDRLHLFGSPSLYRIPHIYHHYDNLNATAPLILFLLDCDCFRVGPVNHSISQN